jgi:hypothetical protein
MSVSKKDKIKNKLAAKKEKLLAKLKGTNEVKKAITATAILCVALFMSGCQSTPSRAQTQTIKDCTFYVMVPPGGATNAAASAVGTVGDLFAQNMVIENSGTETLTPTQTISPTTTLSYGVGGGDSLASLLSSLKSKIGMGGTTAATAGAAAAAGSDCSDGSCEVTQ